MNKLDREEKALLRSVEDGEWRSVKRGKRELEGYREYARATFRKDRRVNIRISGKDLTVLQTRALEEGIPYQTLISSLLHKFVSGRLVEKPNKPMHSDASQRASTSRSRTDAAGSRR